MSELIKKMYEAMATGCGTYMEASHLSEILTYIEYLEANQIPEGHVVVPRDPTDIMVSACVEMHQGELVPWIYRQIWGCMIAAATHGEGE